VAAASDRKFTALTTSDICTILQVNPADWQIELPQLVAALGRWLAWSKLSCRGIVVQGARTSSFNHALAIYSWYPAGWAGVQGRTGRGAQKSCALGGSAGRS
jgi:hypothetical protein